jgi:hypothetical protein
MVGNAFSAQTPIKPENMGNEIVNICVLEKFVCNESNTLKF